MFARTILMLSAVLLIGACSTTDEGSDLDQNAGRDDITQNDALSDIYGTQGVDGEGLAGPEAGTQADLVTSVGDRVFFGYDSYDLSAESRAVLEGQAEWLMRYPHLTITVEGHCDERGTREYNLALGERRANAAKNYLIALGVDPRRVTTISYGKERPAVPGANETAWSQNRRSVTKVD